MAKIMDHLSQGEILAQMAEELADANTMQFVHAKVYSYEETFQRMQEGRDIFC